jgi:hypothetical protein
MRTAEQCVTRIALTSPGTMFKSVLLCLLVIGFAPVALGASPLEFTPLAPRAPSPGTLFESISAQHSGVDLVHEFPASAPLPLMQEQGAGGGVCTGDIDNDGLPDLFATNYDRGCRLYRNLGEWRFQDVTEQAGVRAAGRWCGGATFVDVDNDGDLDLYVCCFNAPNLLYVNQGNGQFKERARDFGLAWTGASVMAAFADYDRDGRLDVYLLTHRDSANAGQRLPSNTRDATDRGLIGRGPDGRPEVTPPFRDLFSLVDKGGGRMELLVAGQPDLLFHQEPNGTFSNVTARAGIQGRDIGLGVSWWDYNADGWPDLYVANDHKTPDRLWRNNRDGTFAEVTTLALPHVPLASMGTDIADVNNDGFCDLLATEMAASTHARRMVIHHDFQKNQWFIDGTNPKQYPRNALYLGTGGERVFEAAYLSGLAATDWTWSPKFGDFDNDGWIDLFIANGMSRDYVHDDLLARMAQPGAPSWRSQPPLLERNLAFRNLGNLQFQRAESTWGLDHLSASFGASLADFDRDGDLDLAVMNFGEMLSLYRNREASAHRVLIRLKGTRSNSWGIGATVSIVRQSSSLPVHGASSPRVSGGRMPPELADKMSASHFQTDSQTRFLHLESGYMSANEPVVHFGLGTTERLRNLTVVWPNGVRQTFQDLPTDRFYTITETSDTADPRPAEAPKPTLSRRSAGIGLRHQEREFDDFAREPLLPWKLSALGPGLAVGDVDGDGDDDVYLGGAAGQAGMLGINESTRRFRVSVIPAFERDREGEDMGSLFFDADSDGDLDLYVVSGGVECEPASALLQDRLYLNDGRGSFQPAPASALPQDRISGSVVCAADFDRDGDLDLFIGGRLVPSQYLAMPESRLLKNERGHFIDATELNATRLRHSGLVTSAVWLDANGDGWIDLAVASEWGPIKLFLNRAGHLEPSAEESAFTQHSGLWQGLEAADLDDDGDIDLIATNLGLNTRYRPSQENPLAIWRGEFGTTGATQLLEAFKDGGDWRPFRRRETLIAVMPTLAETFPTFVSYANATVPQLIPQSKLSQASRFEITTLASGIWINDGHGRFAFRVLPRLAQIAPAFGMVAGDFDGDGLADLALAQNCHGPPAEVGRMDGGLGIILRGAADAQFKPVLPAESGLMLPGEFRALAITDLNQDGAPDLLAAANNGPLAAFENQKRPGSQWLAVRLRGPVGNPTGVGARIEVSFGGGAKRVAEVRAGGGYLSQSSATLFFAAARASSPTRINVRWPDGMITSHTSSIDTSTVTLTSATP